MKTRLSHLPLFICFFPNIILLKANCQSFTSHKQYIDTLIVEGDNIWVRNRPKTGNVIMKLNTGSVCYVLKKGEEQTIRENTDYWYKIIYEGKVGWIFGSQTSLKLGENENFEDFFNRFLEDLQLAEHKDINLRKYISPIHGVNFAYLDTNSNGLPKSNWIKTHYYRESQMTEFWDKIYSEYQITKYSELDSTEQKKRMVIVNTRASVVIPLGIYTDKHTALAVEFKRTEGKWYFYSVWEDVYYIEDEEKHKQNNPSFYDFLDSFIEQYSGRNIDSLIKYNSKSVDFIHPEIGFDWFFNPGASCGPGDLGWDFSGFKLSVPNNYKIYPNSKPNNGYCDIPDGGEKATTPDGIYYEYVDKLPIYFDMTTGGSEQIEWPYPDKYGESRKVVVYIQINGWVGNPMYFMEADGTWWLVIIDYCDCSA